MYAADVGLWGVQRHIQQGGGLWAFRCADDRSVVFTEEDAALRFARILGRAEEGSFTPSCISGEAVSSWVDVLAFADAVVVVEPEYVAGEGIVGHPVPATALRGLLDSLRLTA